MKLLMLVALLLIGWCAAAQSTVKGKVMNEAKEGMAGATAVLKAGKNRHAAVADADGNFLITNLATGNYQLQLRSVGFATHELQVKVKENENLDLGIITLVRDLNQLQTVEVVGRIARKYNSDYSFSATKTATLNKDIPQAISTVTKELISDRQAFQLADAVKITSGVIPSSYYNQYAIRGISQNEEGQLINGMRTRQYYFLQPLTANIERVEVVKGPASATFSSVDPGGSINLVTKKPLATNRKEIALSVGSFSTLRSTLDFTGPLNADKTLLYRVNAAYQDARSFRDLIGQKSILISPSFTYLPSAKTAINAEFIYSNMNGKVDRGQPIFGAVAGETNLNSTPISLNLGATNDFFKSKEVIMMGNLAHQFTSNSNFNLAYMKQTWTEDLLEHRTTNAFAVDTNNQPVTTLAAMQAVQRQQFWNTDNLNSYFNFDVSTGAVTHKLLVGYDLHSWQKLKGGGQNAARGFLLTDGTTTNSFVLANAANYQTITVGGVVLPKPNVPHFDLVNPNNTIRNSSDYKFTETALPAALTTTHAVYLQEQLNWRKLTLLLSLRNEWYTDITHYKAAAKAITVKKTALLPRVGVTYALNENINVYGTYLRGYQPQANTVTLLPVPAPVGSTFDPLESDLKEFGLKGDLFWGQLQVNAALYEINQRNLLINANDPANPDLLVTRGAERSRGFEIDVAGFILPDWQVNASYSYIDARILNDRDANLINARKQNTPYHSANLWTRYNFATGTALKDFGAGLGMQHNGSSIPWFTRAFETPAYTLLDMALYYSPNKSNLQLAFNLNNVTNQTYWIGAQTYLRLFPGAPRQALLTATYKF